MSYAADDPAIAATLARFDAAIDDQSRKRRKSPSAADASRTDNRTEDESTRRTLFLTPASSISIRPVHWLWTERLALGTVALCGGREGVGKTILAYTLAADITRGRLPGVHEGRAKSVIVAATEDSWEHTIVPRLMAADADLTRIYRADILTPQGLQTALSLPQDLTELEARIRHIDAALVILDPLLSRLDAALDTHKDAEVRQAMEPLVTLAGATGACVLGLIHVNKSASTDALTMLMGSRAFAAVARSVLFVMVDPNDEQLRLLGTPKNNLGRTDLPTLAFSIAGEKVSETPEGDVWTGKLQWLGESSQTLRQAIETSTEAALHRTATSEAADWLADYLSASDEPIESALVKREGQKAGHGKDSLHRASERLKVTIRSAGFPRKTYWSLPDSHRTAGRLEITATTATTATTVKGRHIDHTYSNSQSSQSSQSSQLLTAPARATQLVIGPAASSSTPWSNLPPPPGSAEAAAVVAQQLLDRAERNNRSRGRR